MNISMLENPKIVRKNIIISRQKYPMVLELLKKSEIR